MDGTLLVALNQCLQSCCADHSPVRYRVIWITYRRHLHPIERYHQRAIIKHPGKNEQNLNSFSAIEHRVIMALYKYCILGGGNPEMSLQKTSQLKNSFLLSKTLINVYAKLDKLINSS